ncbi:MAG: peptide deformylase [bacterium]|nr:peptide deformylase [bacterium]
MKHTIITEPNPLLRKISAPVPVGKISTPEFQKLLDDMTETMYIADGVGLAAPQIGLSERIIIVETGDHKPAAYINPEIIKTSFRTTMSEEGCLSVPGIYGVVKRHRGVTAKALDRTGKEVTIKTGGLFAIILQHEIDHLNGILFIDKAEKIHSVAERANPKI